MRWLPLFFQVLLYRGSHVPKTVYEPLAGALQHRLADLNVTVRVEGASVFRRRSFLEPTVVVGHSFGGYFALLDALRDQERSRTTLKGVVLLNSHFNSRRAAWYYPGVDQEKVLCPVLTVAGGNDERLALLHVLSDLWETLDMDLPLKFYKVYPNATHFSTLLEERVVDDIEVFVRSVARQTFDKVRERVKPSETRFGYLPLSQMIPRGRDFSRSVHLVDGLFRIILSKTFWTWLHHIAFLMQTPDAYQNFVFTDHGDHILIKSCNLSLEEVQRLCQSLLPIHYTTRTTVLRVPPNVWGLYLWLLLPLAWRMSVDDEATIEWPILHLPVKENVDYYKILHPRRVLRQALDANTTTWFQEAG
jgi:hypothetical protein